MAASQSRSVGSLPAVSRWRPSGLKASDWILPVKPVISAINSPDDRVDDYDLRVIAPGREPGAVGAERDDPDALNREAQRCQLRTGPHVPEANGPGRDRAEPLAIRTDDQAVNRIPITHALVSQPRLNLLASGGIPEADRPSPQPRTPGGCRRE